MKCILHIGLHKTGSSSIQASLASYDDGRTVYADLGTPNHSVALYSAFSSSLETYVPWVTRGLTSAEMAEKRQEFRAALRAQLTREDRDRIILSGESANSLEENDVEELVRFIGEFCDDLKVMAYVRDPAGYAASAFQQRLRGGRVNPMKKEMAGYGVGLKRFATHAGQENLIVRKFATDSLLNGDAVDDFASIFDLNRALIIKKRKNESFSADAIKVLFRFNRRVPLTDGDPDLLRARNRFHAALDFATKDSGKPDPRLFAHLTDRKAAIWLNSQFGFDFETRQDTGSRDALLAWLDTIGDDTVERLITFLRAQGVTQTYDRDPVKLACKIFYLAIENDQFDRVKGKFETRFN